MKRKRTRKRKSNGKKIYALYKGERNLMDGTLEEIAERNGWTVNWTRFMSGKKWQARIRKEHTPQSRLEVCYVCTEYEDKNDERE